MSGIEQQVIDKAAALATSTLANALDDFGLADCILPTLKAVAPGFRCAGPALTVLEQVGDAGTFKSEDFRVGAIIDAAVAGDVVVVQADGANVSTWGGMASFAAKHKGIAGLVCDGGVRDLEEIVGFEFPVYARHVTPTTGRTRLNVAAIGEPIVADGVSVATGDLIVADGTGVVVLPNAMATEIVERAVAFDADDKAAIEDLAQGLTFAQAMAKYTRI